MTTIDTDTKNWINDRVDNREALMWNEFISFMSELGRTKKKLLKYKSKTYRNLVKLKYKKMKR